MSKKIVSFFLAIMIGFSSSPFSVYAAGGEKAYERYEEAKKTTCAEGRWREELDVTIDMKITQGTAKLKTKAVLAATADVSDYSENDISGIKVASEGSMSVLGQNIAYQANYSDGMLYIQYTEPQEKTVDMKMAPNCFQFDNYTADIMKKAKLSGNKITFTIPGNKVKDSAVAVMPGIENIDYDDMKVVVELDESTGKISSTTMDCHAEFQYQDCEAEGDYHIDYRFTGDGNSASAGEKADTEGKEQGAEAGLLDKVQYPDGLILYSDHENLSIRKDDTIALNVGIIKDQTMVEDVSGIAFSIENPAVLKITSISTNDHKKYVQLRGIAEGTSGVTLNDSNTGYSASVMITVFKDNCSTYTLSSVPGLKRDENLANFYDYNGLYIEKFKYEMKDDDSARVSFTVYNTNYSYGAVEVYDEDGNLEEIKLISKMKSNDTSMKEALWDNMGCLVRDSFINHSLGTYRQETGYSKKTTVEGLKIPKNGYIAITNDPGVSAVVGAVNAWDMLSSFYKLTKDVTKKVGKIFKSDSDTSEKLAGEVASTLKTGETQTKEEKEKVEAARDEFVKKLYKSVKKKAVNSPSGIKAYLETLEETMGGTELGNMIVKSAVESFLGSPWKQIKKEFGPAGIGLDVIFSLGKAENLVRQVRDFQCSLDAGAIYIQNQSGNVRTSHKIKVESSTEFSSDTALNVFRVELSQDTLENLRECAPVWYKEFTNDGAYTYNISLLKNGEEIQPDGKVTVSIPIPEKLKFFAHFGGARVYRVEEDGSLTKMEPKIEGDCFVFDTEHFSVYTLVGNEKLQTYVLIGCAVFLGLCVLILFRKIIRTLRKKVKEH